MPTPVYAPFDAVTINALVVHPLPVVEEDLHPRRSIAKRGRDRLERRAPIAVLEVLRGAEDGRVEPNRGGLEEHHSIGSTDVDRRLTAGGNRLRRRHNVARQAEHARDVHDAAQRQDARA